MAEKSEVKLKPCFFIAPIGESRSKARQHSDEVLKQVVSPAAEHCGYAVTRSDQLPQPGIITSEVIKRIVNDPLVIADLTGENPNVFYELAIRHATGKPVIQIFARGILVLTKLKVPFNVHGTRVIEFDIRYMDQKAKAIDEIIQQIRTMELQTSPVDTPISAAGVDLGVYWQNRDIIQAQILPDTISILLEQVKLMERKLDKIIGQNQTIGSLLPFANTYAPASGADLNTDLVNTNSSPVQSLLETASSGSEHLMALLAILSTGEAMPIVFKYIAESLNEHHVRLLNDTGDDLDAALSIVSDVPEGGCIYATSSLQDEDADEHRSYRLEVNRALERGVRYCKVICFSSDLNKDRYQKWIDEFTDKAELIIKGTIDPDAFELLHHPAPMSLDVLISQGRKGDCLEMIVAFAGSAGHGGFSTSDQEMVKDFLERYLKGKVIAEAKDHTDAVQAGEIECACSKYLVLLKEARQAAQQQSATGRKARARHAIKRNPI